MYKQPVGQFQSESSQTSSNQTDFVRMGIGADYGVYESSVTVGRRQRSDWALFRAHLDQNFADVLASAHKTECLLGLLFAKHRSRQRLHHA